MDPPPDVNWNGAKKSKKEGSNSNEGHKYEDWLDTPFGSSSGVYESMAGLEIVPKADTKKAKPRRSRSRSRSRSKSSVSERQQRAKRSKTPGRRHRRSKTSKSSTRERGKPTRKSKSSVIEREKPSAATSKPKSSKKSKSKPKSSRRAKSAPVKMKPTRSQSEPVRSSAKPEKCTCCCCCSCHQCPCEIRAKEKNRGGQKASVEVGSEREGEMIGLGAVLYAAGHLLAKAIDKEQDEE